MQNLKNQYDATFPFSSN